MIDVLGALMGIDMQGFARPEGSDELPPGVSTNPPASTPPPPPPPTSSAPKPSTSNTTPAPPQEEADDLDDDERKAKTEAEKAKKLGSEAYKKREFAEAATHFQKAWDLWPKDITYLTNLGGLCSHPFVHVCA